MASQLASQRGSGTARLSSAAVSSVDENTCGCGQSADAFPPPRGAVAPDQQPEPGRFVRATRKSATGGTAAVSSGGARLCCAPARRPPRGGGCCGAHRIRETPPAADSRGSAGNRGRLAIGGYWQLGSAGTPSRVAQAWNRAKSRWSMSLSGAPGGSRSKQRHREASYTPGGGLLPV